MLIAVGLINKKNLEILKTFSSRPILFLSSMRLETKRLGVEDYFTGLGCC